MRKRLTAILLLSALLLCSCSSCKAELGDAVNVLSGKDRIPPRLDRMASIGEFTVMLTFNEEIQRIEMDYPCEVSSNTAKITLPQALRPGTSIRIQGNAMDSVGNRMDFSGEVYGFNANTPKLIITEISTAGSQRSPDRTELYALSDGDIAGMCLYDGVRSNFISRIVMPSCHVKMGDYIVIHWIEEEPPVSESANVHNISTGFKENPSQFNGIQTLYSEPSQTAEIMDCIVYTNHEGTAHSKFGSKDNLNRVTDAVNQGSWRCDEIPITGICGVNSKNTTATRSMARSYPYKDTDSNADWYVTVTSGASFGAKNTSEEFNR